MIKGQASIVIIYAEASDGTEFTGGAATITGKLSGDGGAFADIAGNPTEIGLGHYYFSLLAAQCNYDALAVRAVSSTTGVRIMPVLIDTSPDLSAVGADAAAAKTAAVAAAASADEAARPGAAMTLEAGERTTLAASVWNALTSGLTTANSIGKWLVDKLNFTYVTPPTKAELDAAVAPLALEATAQAIKGKTDGLTFSTPGKVDAKIVMVNEDGVTMEPLPLDEIDASVAAIEARLEAIEAVTGTYGAGVGGTPKTYTATDTATGAALPGVLVELFTNLAMTGRPYRWGYTNALGQVTFNVDAGSAEAPITYYVRRTLAGASFTNPDTETVP